MIRRLSAAAAALTLGLGIALAGAIPASAVLPTGPADSFSVRTALPFLASCASYTGAITQVGGWSRQSHFSAGVSGNATGDKVVPVTMRLSEPCVNASGGISIRQDVFSSKPTKANDETWAWLGLTLDGIQCVNSSGGEYLRTTLYSSQSVPVTSNTLTGRELGMGNIATNFTTTNCPRLVYMEGFVQTYNKFGVIVTEQVRWSAARYLGNIEYERNPSGNLLSWCAMPENAEALECFGLVDPDPTSWASTCGNTANNGNYGFDFVQFNPLDVETWGRAVAWLGACLFIPLTEFGGFDREGILEAAWLNSPNAEAGAQIVGLADAFTYAPSCGNLFATGSGSVLPGFTLNTCQWTWAEPVKVVIGVGVLLGGLFWFIRFIVDTSWGLMRNAPETPLGKFDK